MERDPKLPKLLETGDIVQDAKFFQEAVTEYQLAYQSLDEKYFQQAVLVKEASEALKPLKAVLQSFRRS